MGEVRQISLLDSINEIRRLAGKGSIKIDDRSCILASERAREITTDFSHEGFEKRKNERSFEYPSFSAVVENIAMSTQNNPIEM